MAQQALQKAKKLIVITGCDSGLGYSLAHRCLEKNLFVVAGCHVKGGDGASQLKKGGACVAYLDVKSKESVFDFTETVKSLLLEENLSKYLKLIIYPNINSKLACRCLPLPVIFVIWLKVAKLIGR